MGKSTNIITSYCLPHPLKTYGPADVNNKSHVIDVAALGQAMPKVVQDPGHIVCTNLIYIGMEEFKNLFYSIDGEHFNMNSTICKHPNLSHETMNLFNKIKFNNKFLVNGCSYIYLNLIEHIIAKYEEDMGVGRDCWESCSVIDLEGLLSCIHSLCDIGGGCSVLCALTWCQIQKIINQHRSCNHHDVIDNTIREILVISVIFKSANECIKDCTIKFRFAVDWNNEPCINPWLTHFVNPKSAVGSMFFSTQQSKIDGTLTGYMQPIQYKNLPLCSQFRINQIIDDNGIKHSDIDTHIGYGLSNATSNQRSIDISDCYSERTQLTVYKITSHCIEPLYGRPVCDHLKEHLQAGVTNNFISDDLTKYAGGEEHNEGMTQGVDWTSNIGETVWPKSWPLSTGTYDLSSSYPGGKNTQNWFWHDWFHYQIHVNFTPNALYATYQPIISNNTTPLNDSNPPNYDSLISDNEAKDFMIPLSFKWLPWISTDCIALSFKYWCDYKKINCVPVPADVNIENNLLSDVWSGSQTEMVLPIYNDSSKSPRLELFVPASNDSGVGETITKYVFEFCVTEVSVDIINN